MIVITENTFIKRSTDCKSFSDLAKFLEHEMPPVPYHINEMLFFDPMDVYKDRPYWVLGGEWSKGLTDTVIAHEMFRNFPTLEYCLKEGYLLGALTRLYTTDSFLEINYHDIRANRKFM